MRLSPSSSSMVGSQPSFFLASVISGCRCLGSSFGNDLNTIFEEEPVMAIIFFANSCIENSFEIHRTGKIVLRLHHPYHSLYQIIDILETARLLSVSIYRDVFIVQCLQNEV